MDNVQTTLDVGFKRCYRCRQEKPPADFYRDRSRRDGLSSACRPCALEVAAENRVNNREHRIAYMRKYYEKNREKFRERALMNLYGLTAEDYGAMLEAQGGGCAICGARDNLHVDHCHTSGKVRAILCRGCNRGLGFYADDPDRLRAAADYLERFRAE